MHIVLLLSSHQWNMSDDSSFLASGHKIQGSLLRKWAHPKHELLSPQIQTCGLQESPTDPQRTTEMEISSNIKAEVDRVWL